MVYGAVCFLLGVISFGFPKKSFNKQKLLLAEQNMQTELSETVQSNEQVQQATCFKDYVLKFLHILKLNLKEFFVDLKKAFKIPQLILIILATTCEGVLLKGFLGFMSKFFEFQFQVTASTSTLITGSIALFSVIAGTLTGAWLINKFKWEAKGCACFCFLVYFFTSFIFWILLKYCPETQFTAAQTDCTDCNCDNKFQPVCIGNYSSLYNSSVPAIYQSACHAGCLSSTDNNTFTNCACLNQNNLLANSTGLLKDAILSPTHCASNLTCVDSLVLNCIVALAIVFITAVALIPSLKAFLGCVDEGFQPFALGIRAAVVRILGNFAGSLTFGYLIDLTCKIWHTNCYNQKICNLYNNKSMSVSLAAIGFTCRFMASMFMLLAGLFFLRHEYILKQKINANEIQIEPIQ